MTNNKAVALLVLMSLPAASAFAEPIASVNDFETKTVAYVQDAYGLKCGNRQDSTESGSKWGNLVSMLTNAYTTYDCFDKDQVARLKIKVSYAYSIKMGLKQSPTATEIAITPVE